MIIIFTNINDLSTLEVAKRLKQMQQDVIIIEPDTAENKFVYIDEENILFRNSRTGREFNLLDATACWWRRSGLGMNNFSTALPEKFIIDGTDLSGLIHGARNLTFLEMNDLRDYIFDKMYKTCKIRIGNPHVMGMNRLEVLDTARQYGLKTPNYAVITNYNQLQMLNKISDIFVSKAIYNGIYQIFGNMSYYSYTEAHHKEDFRDKDIPLFPSLVTSLVEKSYEIRSFYLNRKFYSMAIFSQNNDQTKIDFRKYSDIRPNKNEPFQLPKNIEIKLESIYKKYDLNCGSADFIVDKKGNYVFLEINPVGQFGMTSEPCNYDLEQKIANYLTYGHQ
ncbi:MAG: grasp-with-spasm system ATP-grasp peptide maturase [Bacteroidaceae bacterium]